MKIKAQYSAISHPLGQLLKTKAKQKITNVGKDIVNLECKCIVDGNIK
jgi:hypothetical protein